MELLSLVLAGTPAERRRFLGMLAVAGLGTTLILAIVNRAAQSAEAGPSLRLALLFLAALASYTLAQRHVSAAAARAAEGLILRLRREIVAELRDADLDALQRIGRAPIHAALTAEAQTVSASLPVVVVGGQQAVLLVFVSAYLAWLSPMAFLLSGLFGVFAVWFHVTRGRALRESTGRLETAQAELWEALRGLLSGFREATLNEARGEALADGIGRTSGTTRHLTARIKRRWSGEYVATQSLFYLLLGLMVFVVPAFTTSYHRVVVEATMGALFMVGPLGGLAQSVPALGDAARALRRMRDLREALRGTAAPDLDEAAEELPPGTSGRVLELDGLRTAYQEAPGRTGFTLGPVSATFRAGEIAFITGGNGSGKTTLFRLMTGLARPDGGRLLLDGVPIGPERLAAYRDRIAVVFADGYLFRELYGLDAVDPARVEALLDRFGLAGKTALVEGAFTTTALSAGQRKRLALVVALLQEAPILMLDEWAADQDPLFRRDFYESLLPELRDMGRMVICITHDDRYFGAADRLWRMEDGRMAERPAPEAGA